MPAAVQSIECQSLSRWTIDHCDLFFVVVVVVQSIPSRFLPLVLVVLVEHDVANLEDILSNARNPCYRQRISERDERASC